MTATMIREVEVDVSDDLNRAKEVVAEARSDAHTALIAHNALLTIETLAQQVQQAEQALRAERQQWADWVEFAVERSTEVADEQDWCEVFDNAMESLGLPPRHKPTEDVSWWCTVTMHHEVDDDDVISKAEEALPSDAEDVEVYTSAVVSFTVRVTGTFDEQPEGDCICENVDRYTIRDAASNQYPDYTYEDEGDIYCDNCG